MVPVSPWSSVALEPPPDPGTVALSTLFRLVCFGGFWWAAVVVVRAEEVGDGGDRRALGSAGRAQGAGDRVWGLFEMVARDPDGLALVLVEVPPEHPLRRRQ